MRIFAFTTEELKNWMQAQVERRVRSYKSDVEYDIRFIDGIDDGDTTGKLAWILRDFGTHLIPIEIEGAVPEIGYDLVSAVFKTWAETEQYMLTYLGSDKWSVKYTSRESLACFVGIED